MEDASAYQATIQLLVDRYKEMVSPKLLVLKRVVSYLEHLWRLNSVWVLYLCVSRKYRATVAQSYELGGTDTLITDAIVEGDKVLVVDDLLATGGTIEATTNDSSAGWCC